MIRFFFSLILFLLFSCSQDESTKNLIAKGDKQYGGEFRFMSLEKINHLFPLNSMDLYTQRINTQIYESLFREDSKNNKVLPHLVEKYSISKDGLTYTFQLKKGIFFHKDPCFKEDSRELNAKDIQFLMKFACSQSSINHLSHLLVGKIEGSKELFEITKSPNKQLVNLKGFNLIDEYRFSIKLTKPYANFIQILSHPGLGVFPPEAFEKYKQDIIKHPVSTGPFMLDHFSKDGIKLKRNPNYWRKDKFGNQLPFLDKVILKYGKDKNSELKAFEKNEIDLILEIPSENVMNFMGTLQDAQKGKTIKHKVVSRNSSVINYLVFANDKPPFDDIKVRKAFLYAINRERITNEALNGEGNPAKYGFIPSVFGYQSDTSYSITHDVAKAKNLLAQAGFENGLNFPEIALWVNSVEGSSMNKWTKDVVEQLNTNLNLQLKIKLCTFEERQEAIRNGKAIFWRSGWVPDYADPESYLSIFYKPYSDINPFWSSVLSNNPQFNKTYELSLLEKNSSLRNKLLNQCNQLLIDDALVLPIYSNDFFAVLNLKMRDFVVNALETIDLSCVYIKNI